MCHSVELIGKLEFEESFGGLNRGHEILGRAPYSSTYKLDIDLDLDLGSIPRGDQTFWRAASSEQSSS